MKNFLKIILFLTLFLPTKALAQVIPVTTDIGRFNNIAQYVSTLLNQWLIPWFLAPICVIMIIYVGYLYMTSQGNPEAITRAKDILIGVISGIVLIFLIEVLINNVIGLQTPTIP